MYDPLNHYPPLRRSASEVSPPSTEEKARQEALFLYSILMKNPLVESDPRLIWDVTANMLKAHLIADPSSLIGPRPTH